MADDDDLFPNEEATTIEGEPESQAAQPEPTQQVEPEKKAEPEPAKDPVVPLAALQEVRGENRTLKERLSSIEQMLMQQTAPKPPDVLEDPQGFAAMIEQRLAAQQTDIYLTVSENQARASHGDAVVDAAFQAAEAAGILGQFAQRKDGWGDLVRWHKGQKAMAEIGDDPAAYAARLEEQIRAKVLAELAAKPATIPAAPSLAGQANLGTRAAPSWAGPTPLEDILGGRG